MMHDALTVTHMCYVTDCQFTIGLGINVLSRSADNKKKKLRSIFVPVARDYKTEKNEPH